MLMVVVVVVVVAVVAADLYPGGATTLETAVFCPAARCGGVNLHIEEPAVQRIRSVTVFLKLGVGGRR